jgi:hypothetical protein
MLASERDNAPQTVETTWRELAEGLTEFRRGPCTLTTCPGKACRAKSGPAWMPAVTDGVRKTEHVQAITVAAFDIDHVPFADLCALSDRLEAAGAAFVLHSTHNHRPPNDCAVRLVMPLSRECKPAEWPRVRAAAVSKYKIPADPKARDLARLFFLPSAPEGAEVIAESFDGGALSVDTLLAAAEAPSAPPRDAVPAAQVAPAVDVPEAEGGPADMEAIRRRLRQVEKAESREIIARVLKGEPLAEQGARDDTLNRACGILACALPPDTAEEVFLELLRPSILAMPNPDGADWFAEAADMISRARVRREENDAKRDQFAQEVRARLSRESSAAGAPAAPAASASPALQVVKEDAPPAPAADPAAPYTDEQLEAWGRELGCDSLDELNGRWIVSRGKTYWVLVDGRYQSPIGEADLEVSLPRDLARSPVELFRFDKDGNAKPAKVKEILRDHSVVARDVQASLALQRSFYDPGSQTFFEAVRPLRPLHPREHPEIQAWLELLGGDQAPKLLDWVSTVTRLDRQSCAVYFHAVRGVGKNLFACGLARLWTPGAPAELERVLGGFNDVLTVCPLIFADEKLPQVKGIFSSLRKLVGETARNLNRKFMPACNLAGAIRLVIAANNDRLFDEVGSGEDLSTDDLDAVAARFLYLRPRKEAAEFLLDIGGPPVINRWVEDNLIAEHALWLRDTRAVDESGRFLVEGETSEFHDHLATSGTAGLVAEWLVRYLADAATRNIPNPKILIGEGEVFVATEALASEAAWSQRVPAVSVPSAGRIGHALSNLSVGNEAITVGENLINFHRIKPELLLSWAKRAKVGNAEAMLLRIRGENKTIAEVRRKRGLAARPLLTVLDGGAA